VVSAGGAASPAAVFVLPGARGTLTLLLFAGLAVLHTWPLASAPGTHSRNDNADVLLNEWIMAWVAHQVLRDPLRLFHANIFHPEPNVLAFSEHLFVQGMLGAPLHWLGVSPVAVHNLVILAGLALTGWAMCFVMTRWTGDWMAGLVAGSLFAFNAHTLTRMAHVQAMHVEFLPFALLALDRLLRRPGMRPAVALGLLFALQGLASNHLLVFTTFALVAAALVRPEDWWGRRGWQVAGYLALAAVVGVLIVTPFLLPYYRVRAELGLVRGLEEISMYSGLWQAYLTTGGRLHFGWWSGWFWPQSGGTALFPGATAIGLALFAVWRGVAWTDRRARMGLVAAAVGFVLSFGLAVPGYLWLYHSFPLLQGIRAPIRFGHLFLAAIAVLAGFGLARVRRARLRPGWRRLATAAVFLLVTLEALRAPMGFTSALPTPEAYGYLATEPGAVVAEFPFFAPRDFHRNGPYVRHSTTHWRPILNGYSGFLPASYHRHWEGLRDFPAPSALSALARAGVTHVVVHVREFARERGGGGLEELGEVRSLRLAVSDADIRIYRFEPAALGEWRP
jgi:hypothetical protein